jgi:hypothetical protein
MKFLRRFSRTLVIDGGFALLVFPLFTSLILQYPAWQLGIFGVFVLGSRVYLRWIGRFKKGRLLLPWAFSCSALGFLGVLGGGTIPPAIIAGTLSILILLVLIITRQISHNTSPLARKWLEITLYLTLFLGVSFLFGLTYIYPLWWGIVVLVLGIFSLPMLRLLFKLKNIVVHEPFFFICALLMMEMSLGYFLLPISHTILAAALVVFVVASVSLYQLYLAEKWSWRRGGGHLLLFVILEGSLLLAGL